MAEIVPVATWLDLYSLSFTWGMMKGGDIGQRVSAWAFPHLAFHLTGNTDLHSVDIMGSNDGSCYGVLATLIPKPEVALGDHLHDTLFKADDLPRVRFLKPLVRGDGVVADCSVVLFATREFGVRPD